MLILLIYCDYNLGSKKSDKRSAEYADNAGFIEYFNTLLLDVHC